MRITPSTLLLAVGCTGAPSEEKVLLMTEYADSNAWANRESTFEGTFASPV